MNEALLIVASLCVILLVLLLLFGLRYGSFGVVRGMYLQTLGAIQGHKVISVRSNPELCARVLAKSADKGNLIEGLVACPAWAPAFSVESVNGALWKRLRKIVTSILPRVEVQSVREAAEEVVDEWFAATKKHSSSNKSSTGDAFMEIHADVLMRWTCHVMYMSLFGRKLDSDELQLYLEGCKEWRREIAVKGFSNHAIKTRVMIHLERSWKNSKKHRVLLEAQKAHGWTDKEITSAFLQPFIVSPMINVADIMVGVHSQLQAHPDDLQAIMDAATVERKTQKQLHLSSSDRWRGVILESIRLSHPFPLLERVASKDIEISTGTITAGTHVVIEVDSFEQPKNFDPSRWNRSSSSSSSSFSQGDGKTNSASGGCPYAWMPFGTGPRKCVGEHLAMALLSALLEAIICKHKGFSRLNPRKHHAHSGRNNDQTINVRETAYFIYAFFLLLGRSIRNRLKS